MIHPIHTIHVIHVSHVSQVIHPIPWRSLPLPLRGRLRGGYHLSHLSHLSHNFLVVLVWLWVLDDRTSCNVHIRVLVCHTVRPSSPSLNAQCVLHIAKSSTCPHVQPSFSSWGENERGLSHLSHVIQLSLMTQSRMATFPVSKEIVF